MYQKSKYQPSGKAEFRNNGWHKYYSEPKKLKPVNPVMDMVFYLLIVLVIGYILVSSGMLNSILGLF